LQFSWLKRNWNGEATQLPNIKLKRKKKIFGKTPQQQMEQDNKIAE
jgi:hypothetical protein